MAEKANKDNKHLIIGICTAVVVVVVIAVIAILVNRGGAIKIDDSYFVSDDTKYVLTTESGEYENDDDEYAPAKTHLVYNYSGDKITGVFTYLEYNDEASAKAAYEVYKASDDQEGVKSINLNGKYIVVEMTEENYKDMTASDVKKEIEFMEALKNSNLNNDNNDNSTEVDE